MKFLVEMREKATFVPNDISKNRRNLTWRCQGHKARIQLREMNEGRGNFCGKGTF